MVNIGGAKVNIGFQTFAFYDGDDDDDDDDDDVGDQCHAVISNTSGANSGPALRLLHWMGIQ